MAIESVLRFIRMGHLALRSSWRKSHEAVPKVFLGEAFFICWITLHQVKIFRAAIAKKDRVK